MEDAIEELLALGADICPVSSSTGYTVIQPVPRGRRGRDPAYDAAFDTLLARIAAAVGGTVEIADR